MLSEKKEEEKKTQEGERGILRGASLSRTTKWIIKRYMTPRKKSKERQKEKKPLGARKKEKA